MADEDKRDDGKNMVLPWPDQRQFRIAGRRDEEKLMEALSAATTRMLEMGRPAPPDVQDIISRDLKDLV